MLPSLAACKNSNICGECCECGGGGNKLEELVGAESDSGNARNKLEEEEEEELVGAESDSGNARNKLEEEELVGAESDGGNTRNKLEEEELVDGG